MQMRGLPGDASLVNTVHANLHAETHEILLVPHLEKVP